MKTNWRDWIKCALIRAIKTVAQSAIALIGVACVISDVDWIYVGSASALAGLISILTSLAGLPEVDEIPSPVIGRTDIEDAGGE